MEMMLKRIIGDYPLMFKEPILIDIVKYNDKKKDIFKIDLIEKYQISGAGETERECLYDLMDGFQKAWLFFVDCREELTDEESISYRNILLNDIEYDTEEFLKSVYINYETIIYKKYTLLKDMFKTVKLPSIYIYNDYCKELNDVEIELQLMNINIVKCDKEVPTLLFKSDHIYYNSQIYTYGIPETNDVNIITFNHNDNINKTFSTITQAPSVSISRKNIIIFTDDNDCVDTPFIKSDKTCIYVHNTKELLKYIDTCYIVITFNKLMYEYISNWQELKNLPIMVLFTGDSNYRKIYSTTICEDILDYMKKYASTVLKYNPASAIANDI